MVPWFPLVAAPVAGTVAAPVGLVLLVVMTGMCGYSLYDRWKKNDWTF